MNRNSHSENSDGAFFEGSKAMNLSEIDSMFESLKSSEGNDGISSHSLRSGEGSGISDVRPLGETARVRKLLEGSGDIFSEENGQIPKNPEMKQEISMQNADTNGTFPSSSSFSSSSSSEVDGNSRVFASRSLNLPVPGKRLQSLMNRVSTVQTTSAYCGNASSRTLWDENGTDFRMRSGETVSGTSVPSGGCEKRDVQARMFPERSGEFRNSGGFSAETLFENRREVQENFRSDALNDTRNDASENLRNDVQNGVSGNSLNDVLNDVQGSVRNVFSEKLLKETASESEKDVSKRQKRFLLGSVLCLGFEISCGLILGIGLILALMSIQNPLEKRVIHEFQKTLPGTLTCDGAENNFMKTELTYGPMFTQDSPEKVSRTDMNIMRTDVFLAPVSHVSRALRVRSVSLEGVEFPGLTTLEPCETWRPEVLSPLFTREGAELLKVHPESLESLKYLEDVKAKHLPEFQALSGDVARISAESEAVQKRLQDVLGVKELTAEILQSSAALREDIVADVEKLSVLKKEAEDIQERWTVLNQTVAGELGAMKEKIAADGQHFSNVLQCECPDDEKMSAFLYKADFQKRTAETSDWLNAVCRMVELGMLSRSPIPAASLKTSGTIELFGQNFAFDGSWNTRFQEECVYSYSGNLHLSSDVIPEELMKDAFVTISCKKKENSTLKTVTARIPLVNETFLWGDYEELPLWVKSRDAVVVLDLTVFGDEIRGKISVEMNQVAFDVPTDRNMEPCRKSFYAPFAEQVLPQVLVSAQISGTREIPLVKCSGSETETFRKQCVNTLQEVYRTTRKEILAAMYERLKNAETAFNGTLEPFYQEIVLCAKNTDVFHDFQVRVPQDSAPEAYSDAEFAENSDADAGSDSVKTKAVAKNRKKNRSGSGKRAAVVEVTPMSLAHVELSPEDIDENIPMYNPNLGIEPVAPPVGSAVNVGAASKVKVVPVKKVAEIAPITPASAPVPAVPAASVPVSDSAPVSAAVSTPVSASVPAAVPAPALTPETAPAMIPAASSQVSANPAASASAAPVSQDKKVEEVIPEGNGTVPQEEKQPLNVADPVLYSSSPAEKALPPVNVPVQKSSRKATPLPMMKSTSNFGS